MYFFFLILHGDFLLKAECAAQIYAKMLVHHDLLLMVIVPENNPFRQCRPNSKVLLAVSPAWVVHFNADLACVCGLILFIGYSCLPA